MRCVRVVLPALFGLFCFATVVLGAGVDPAPNSPVAAVDGAHLVPPLNAKTMVLGVLYDQTQVQWGDGWTAQDFGVGYESFDSEGADDFQVTSPEGWTVDEVLVAGSYSEGGGPASSAAVVFYANSTTSVGPAGVECATTGRIVSDQDGVLTLDLANPCLLGQGRHWLGIQVVQDFSEHGSWWWVGTATRTGEAARWRNPGGGFETSCQGWGTLAACLDAGEVDFVFRLSGTDHGGGGGGEVPPDGSWGTFSWVGAPGVFNFEGPLALTTTTAGSLDVTDAFVNGDRFQVYDGTTLLGTTSAPTNVGQSHTTDPDVAFADPQWSSGSFPLGPGEHSVTIRNVAIPPGHTDGAGFIRWRATGGGGTVVPGDETQASAPGATVGTAIGSATDRFGDRIIVWKQTLGKVGAITQGDGVFGRFFGADGSSSQPFPVDTTSGGDVTKPSVTFNAEGSFVIGWEKTAGGGGVFGRVFNPDQQPQGGSFQMDEGTGAQVEAPKVASSAAGQFMAAWRQSVGKQGDGVFGRFFDPSGQPTGGATRVDLGGATEVSLPAAAADVAGNFLVVWHQRAPSKTLQGGDGIFGRPFNPAGVPQDEPVPVNTDSTGDPMDPVVASDASGNSVVVWIQNVGVGDGLDVWARRVAPGGLPIGTQFKVNATAAGTQVKPSVGLNAAGDFAVAWESGPAGNKSIFGRFFTADGVPLGPDFEVARTEGGAVPETPSVTVDGTDLVTVCYTKASSTGRTVVYRPFEVTTAPSTCDPNAQTLCLNDSRFQVRVAWRNYNDNSTGVGRAVPVTADTGYFWFFNSANVELVVKVLDGTWLNDNFWVFYGALSDVEYTITVTDTQTGGSVTYFNPARNLASVADTGALPGSAAAPPPKDYKVMTASGPADGVVLDRAMVWGELVGDGEKVLACTPTATDLCLNGNRFRVGVSWRNYNDGSTGSGQAVSLTGDTGYFWFFSDANIELILKVLDGRALNGHFWVFYGALSDVEYTITVTDTVTGQVRSYFNPPRQLASVADTSAFAVP